MYEIQNGITDNKANYTLEFCKQNRKTFGKIYETKDQIIDT